jgi:hypothetical protein
VLDTTEEDRTDVDEIKAATDGVWEDTAKKDRTDEAAAGDEIAAEERAVDDATEEARPMLELDGRTELGRPGRLLGVTLEVMAREELGRIAGEELAAAAGVELDRTTGVELGATTGEELAATTGEELAATTGEELAATTGEELPATTGVELAAMTGKELAAMTGVEMGATITMEEVAPAATRAFILRLAIKVAKPARLAKRVARCPPQVRSSVNAGSGAEAVDS